VENLNNSQLAIEARLDGSL